METGVAAQGAALLWAAALGTAAGILYDVLRPARRRVSAGLGAVLDGFFALLCALGIFSYAMTVGSGKLGTWSLEAALLGFLLYLHWLSGFVLPALEAFFQLIGNLLESGKKIIKKFQVFNKKLFQKLRE